MRTESGFQTLPSDVSAGSLSLTAPATRREVLLFGLLIIALVWFTFGRERTVVIVPDEAVRVGIVT